MFTTTNTTTILSTLNFAREQWKTVDLGEGYSNETKLEVSDFGRLRITNTVSKGRLINGSKMKDLHVIHLKMFRPRTPEAAAAFAIENAAMQQLSKELRQLIKEAKNPQLTAEEKASLQLRIDDLQEKHTKEKAAFQKRLDKDVKARTYYFSGLVHRLVAEAFLPKPQPEQTIVINLDHNRSNNRVDNLQWVTPDEAAEHARKHPNYVEYRYRNKDASNTSNTKLTITKVMYLKKLLKEGKPIKSLAKQFKITETQVKRIQKNENWAHIEAAD